MPPPLTDEERRAKEDAEEAASNLKELGHRFDQFFEEVQTVYQSETRAMIAIQHSKITTWSLTVKIFF